MTTWTRCLPLLALTLSLAACDSEPSAATPAPIEPAPEPQMQMLDVDEPAPETDAEAPAAAPAAEETVLASGNRSAIEIPTPPMPTKTSARDRSLVPAGTPEANAEAFTAMRQGKHDSAPVGGIGPEGIHIDSLVVGRGFTKSRCEEATQEFVVGDDDRANVCIRVVHGGANDQQLKVKWTRNGRGPKVTTLNLKNAHAYRTRAYLPLRHYSAGDWTVTVTAADGTVLGESKFTVSK